MTLAERTATVSADAVLNLLDRGYLRFYSGPMPMTPDLAPREGQILLAECRFSRPAFEAADQGTALARPLAAVRVRATGITTWCRAVREDGVTTVFDATVDEGLGGDVRLSSTALQRDAELLIDQLRYTQFTDCKGA